MSQLEAAFRMKDKLQLHKLEHDLHYSLITVAEVSSVITVEFFLIISNVFREDLRHEEV